MVEDVHDGPPPKNKLSRRGFLELAKVAAGTAILAATGCAPKTHETQPPPASQPTATPEQPIGEFIAKLPTIAPSGNLTDAIQRAGDCYLENYEDFGLLVYPTDNTSPVVYYTDKRAFDFSGIAVLAPVQPNDRFYLDKELTVREYVNKNGSPSGFITLRVQNIFGENGLTSTSILSVDGGSMYTGRVDYVLKYDERANPGNWEVNVPGPEKPFKVPASDFNDLLRNGRNSTDIFKFSRQHNALPPAQ